jgi:hypothetical protein
MISQSGFGTNAVLRDSLNLAHPFTTVNVVRRELVDGGMREGLL